MASTSPYDGRPSDPSPDPDPDKEVSFVRVITIRPPAPGTSRFRSVARLIWDSCKRLVFAALGGGSGVLVYCLIFPAERHFKPFPPWGSEAYIIFSIFLFMATCVWILTRKRS